MSIRYYLFLFVGVITTFVFLGSFILEGLLLRERMTKARQLSIESYEEIFAKRREQIEEIVLTKVAKNLAQINSVLDAIAQFKPLSDWFAPTEENIQKGTWTGSTSAMLQDEWIQLIQNTTGGKLLSLVIPEKGPFYDVKVKPIEEGLAWVYVTDSNTQLKPFLGIEMPLKEMDLGDEFFASGAKSYALYRVEKLKDLELPEESGFEEGPFSSFLARAVTLAQSANFTYPKLEEEKKQEPFEDKSFQGMIRNYFHEREEYGSQLFLLSQLSKLMASGALGQGSSLELPDGLSFPLKDGQMFFLQPILGFSAPLFDDEAFFKAHPPKEGEAFSSSSCLIQSPTRNQAFLGNTAVIQSGPKALSFLTMGVDLGALLENVIGGFRQYGIALSGGKVVINQAPEGKPTIESSKIQEALLQNMDKLNGSFMMGGANYYFSHIHPDPNLDLHFFFVQSEIDELGSFYQFQNALTSILRSIAVDRRILQGIGFLILWIVLLYASNKVTKPLLDLAACLRQIKKGKFEDAQIPAMKFKKKNEIQILYNSICEMVEGMKEKEKVTAILNKVVSQEIACEILKGDVKLGGEERLVTMLFGDIRGFTHLTQNMPPHEVISFLNKCMTKLSYVIEEHKGVIDKYLGDGIMAIYGAPISDEEGPLHAIMAALNMVEVLKAWNLERIQKGLDPVYVGIGVHTGPVCAGNMGAYNRLNYTVIGSNVNMASRLCSSAEAEEILITEPTYLQPCVKENVEVEPKGLRSFKGFDEEVMVYRVLGLKEHCKERLAALKRQIHV